MRSLCYGTWQILKHQSYMQKVGKPLTHSIWFDGILELHGSILFSYAGFKTKGCGESQDPYSQELCLNKWTKNGILTSQLEHLYVVLCSAVNISISAYYKILIFAKWVFNICSINYCTYCNFQVEFFFFLIYI